MPFAPLYNEMPPKQGMHSLSVFYNDHRQAKTIEETIVFSVKRQVWQQMILSIICAIFIINTLNHSQKSKYPIRGLHRPVCTLGDSSIVFSFCEKTIEESLHLRQNPLIPSCFLRFPFYIFHALLQTEII